MTKIMVVDDAVFMRTMMKEILKSEGFEIVAEAANGEEAVQLYKQVKPDVVTMDITMPEMDGVDALAAIKKIDPQAKVIMCSAMGQQEMVIRAIRAGAMDFIVKPIQKDRVIAAVKKVL
ncbi:two-component system response regulator [Paenibacillus contaminans]|uniref:Two-component system response regulator n=2 Tax=Paenibacillus contaminans TaxID=450362 RepID=A0A329M3P5_9BACL|nr:two-component system response regulator [Paenibacillus contaminans]